MGDLGLVDETAISLDTRDLQDAGAFFWGVLWGGRGGGVVRSFHSVRRAQIE